MRHLLCPDCGGDRFEFSVEDDGISCNIICSECLFEAPAELIVHHKMDFKEEEA